MARLPLIDESASPDIAALAAKIRGARGGKLHEFYRALLHTPGLASAWFDFNNAVRFQTALDDRVRELVIMRVAVLTGCDYVFEVHKAQYAKPAGVTPEEVEALRERSASPPFGERDSALLAYVDAMSRDVEVADSVFRRMRGHFSDREVVELTVLTAAYNMHTRFLKALGFEPEERDE
ncbi:MAG: carboxymuconolactone decarboxylase family protein [Burkholderiales bacterium]